MSQENVEVVRHIYESGLLIEKALEVAGVPD
jgi:hypothetical protein